MQDLVNALPKVIRVAAFDIEIVTWRRHEAVGQGKWGEFSPFEQLIRIDEDISSTSKLADTLVHEIGHAIWWAYGIEDGDKEERVVSANSTTWVQIWRDNPDLLGWLNMAVARMNENPRGREVSPPRELMERVYGGTTQQRFDDRGNIC